ncbi:hypothetical protein BofuT4_uP003070.1 [Botrytis cinerea T4]|uniref:Uncharacterized protein n=1 Tax=Botryotinia fuckeliana (strain T4) TaxID=999810 RepID=G2Y3A8_BOTF4|nr:hypothetical protein BofuT4_uP003070.1 [Botrytis cinerea T4]
MAQEQVLRTYYAYIYLGLVFSSKACKPYSEPIPDRALYLLGNVDNEHFLGLTGCQWCSNDM